MAPSLIAGQRRYVKSEHWLTCCGRVPREQIVFLLQVAIAYVVIIVSLANITFSNENTCLWASLASGTIGYLLPNPSVNYESAILRSTAV
jgi:hypothetical protein